MMAVLLCATSFSTNFWGLAPKNASSITGHVDANAASDVTYGSGETYYDAGTLNMTAYYDSTTGTELTASASNYKSVNWDVDSASSFVSDKEQNSHTGVTVENTTDIADASKYGSASPVSVGGDGQRGIMCFSEYLDALNNGNAVGSADYKGYEKYVVDYEAPAAVTSKTYVYMAKGETTATSSGKNQIKWTLMAWPQDQSQSTRLEQQAKLDTVKEITDEWAKLRMQSKTVGNTTLDVPGEIIKDGNIVADNTSGALDTASMFYTGQPVWLSGNKGSFDSWDNGVTDTASNTDYYLKNLGLWGRIQTYPVEFGYATDNTGANDYEHVTITKDPAVYIDLFAPSNTGDTAGAGNVSFYLTENGTKAGSQADTDYLPLYSYMDDTYASASSLSSMSFKSIIDTQLSGNTATTDKLSKGSVSLPVYNVPKQLYDLWETSQYNYLRGVSTITAVSAHEVAANSKSSTTFTGLDITGTRLYDIAAHIRADVSYVKSNPERFTSVAATQTSLTNITNGVNPVSSYIGSTGYGIIGNNSSAASFVLNTNDINTAKSISHINSCETSLTKSDILSTYNSEGAGSGTTILSQAVNTQLPMIIRADAYYDATEDYQRAAGILYGQVDSDTPSIDTTAADTQTNGKTAVVSATDSITDTVYYSNLESGASYKLEGALVTSDGATTVATASTTLNPSAASGNVSVKFGPFDSTSYASKKLVVTEKLYKGAGTTPVATHYDLTDADQTITYVAAGTAVVNTKAALSNDQNTISDTVTYSGLTSGTAYTVTTTAYDLTAGSSVTKSGSSDTLSVTTAVTPSSASGTMTTAFTGYNATSLAGHKVVIFESVAKTSDSSVVAVHNDKTDTLQTVTFGDSGNVDTVATSGTGSKYLDPVDAETISDAVTVTGLSASTSYTAKATLYDATAGKLVTDTNNKTLSWTKTFATDASGAGTATVAISSFSAADKAGHSLVVYEDIQDGSGNSVATHADASDADQTVTVNSPGVATVLTDSNGNKSMTSSASMSFKDTITYSGLVPGNRYYMKSSLIDKSTGNAITDSDGNAAVIASTVFIANSTGSNKGTAEVKCTNMASKLSGKSIVAYNDLYRVTDSTAVGTTVTASVPAELLVSEHDLSNTDQTVAIDATISVSDDSVLDTVAKGVDGSKTIPLATNSVIKDKVTYKGLVADKTYTLTADVYDTSTSERAVGYTTVKTMDFTADDGGAGSTTMTIDLDTTSLAGHNLVVYEVLKLGDTTIARHRDLTDADQTVTVGNTYQASIDTVATDSVTGGKSLMSSSSASISDKVTYSGLDTNQSYKLTSSVYDKSTGKVASGVADVSTSFTPESASGNIVVTIPVNSSSFTSGQSLVVYETLTTTVKSTSTSSSKTVTVAKHEDISDTDQTVTFVKMSTYLTGDGTASKTIHAGADAYAIDVCSFTGLTPGRTYVINGQLVDAAVGSGAVTLGSSGSSGAVTLTSGKSTSPAKTDTTAVTQTATTATGQPVATRTMEFTPTTANGSIAMQVNVNTSALSGHQLVATATVTDKASGSTVVTHNDLSNADQTISVQTRVEAQTGVYSTAWIFGLIAVMFALAALSYGIGMIYDRKHSI